MKQITETQAQQVLDAVRAQYQGYILDDGSEPKLRPPNEECSFWTIAWEDPYEWAFHAFQGGIDEEMYALALDAGADSDAAKKIATREPHPLPRGVWIEPIYSWLLGLYPAE